MYDYYYDDRYRLVEVQQNGTVVESYAYDANGNRISHSSLLRGVVNQAASYVAGDQLAHSGNALYSYDANGRLNQKTVTDNGETALTQYQYSSTGRLLAVTTADKAITYRHNALGQRVAKLVDGVVTEKYLWQDLTTLLAVYHADGTVKQRFEYGLGHTPVSFSLGGQRYYIQSDHLGSPRVISNSSGVVVKAISYDSYGNVIEDSNPDFSIPFGFAGGLYDADTGLIRFGFRDYDPETGRWTARDPIGFAGGDTNLYGYVLGDPVNFTDIKGLAPDLNWTSMQPIGDWRRMNKLDANKEYFSVGSHGNPQEIQRGPLRIRSADDFAERLLREGYDKSKPLKIYACETGQGDNSIAEQLSKVLGVPVTAPTGFLMINHDGSYFIQNGVWRTFNP